MPRQGLDRAADRAAETCDDVLALVRLARDLPGFLRRPLTLDRARARLRERLDGREQRFLAIVERAVYGRPTSPYARLLRQAGCEPGDVRALVAREGIEGALAELAARGVYVTFDEFKGRCETVRGSQRFSFRERDFDNPLARPHFTRFTGGSGGRPSRVPISLGLVEEQAVSTALMLAAHGVKRPRHACWWPIPINWMLVCAALGDPVVGWYYPVHPLPGPAVLLARYLALGRLGGARFPLPERYDLDRPERMVDRVRALLADGRQLVLRTTPSAGARLSAAAVAAGRDLRGLALVLGGEPVTVARRQQIEASGARPIVLYGSVELAGLSYSCAQPETADDVHVMLDRFALAQHRRPASTDGPTVDSLLFTSLSLATGKLAFNAELGDSARVEERDCGCLLGTLGLRTHLTDIRSFEKLTGEGVTFVRSNLQQVLEQVLPARFGGRSVDYQLVEEEADDSSTRLVLRVSPAVGEVDDAALRTAFLDEIGRKGPVDRYHAKIWQDAGTVQVRRLDPLVTVAGKVLPFHSLRQPDAAGRPVAGRTRGT